MSNYTPYVYDFPATFFNTLQKDTDYDSNSPRSYHAFLPILLTYKTSANPE